MRSLVWSYLNTKIRKRFPSVRPVSTQMLAAWLTESCEIKPILLDVRQPEEFAVSHLPGARSIATVDAAIKAGLEPSTPLVAYCSIGYRSARLAAQLQEAGFTQVYNLEGSIFQWFNEGRQVMREGQPVEQVHPYNRFWGLLVEPRVKNVPRALHALKEPK